MKKRFSLFTCIVVTAFLLGCGRDDEPKLGGVRGTVTMDGQPLKGVNVLFQPPSGRPSQGITNSEGKYELEYSASRDGVLIGTHTVIITAAAVDSDEENQPSKKTSRLKIPQRYSTLQSELTAEVKRGRNTIDFALSPD